MVVEFHWRTTGTRNISGLEVCHTHPAVLLMIAIFLAVVITILVTGKVSIQEDQASQADLQSIQYGAKNPEPRNR